jgi:nicotinamide N-methyltransferase/methyltransferase
MADLLPSNLGAVNAWLSQAPAAHNWHLYTTKILSLEGSAAPTADQVAAREDLTRTRMQSLCQCDVLKDPPLSGDSEQTFDLVIAGFCLEVAVNDAASFHKAVLNVLSLVAPGGIGVVMGLHRCSRYTVNAEWHAC